MKWFHLFASSQRAPLIDAEGSGSLYLTLMCMRKRSLSLVLVILLGAGCEASAPTEPNATKFKVRSIAIEASGVEFEVESDPGDRIGVELRHSWFEVRAFEGALSKVTEAIERDTQQTIGSKTITSSAAKIAFGDSMTVIDSLVLSKDYEYEYRVSSGTFGNSRKGESLTINNVTLMLINDSTFEAVIQRPVAAGVISTWGWGESSFTVSSNSGRDEAEFAKRIISEKPDAFLRIRMLIER
jgi:hypothetical protein